MKLKNILKSEKHPVTKHKWNFGQRAADKLTAVMGSWIFIIFS